MAIDPNTFKGLTKAQIRQAIRNGAASGSVAKVNYAREVLQAARKQRIFSADEAEELKRDNHL